MLAEGAAIIDIGAYSTRPGAHYITETEEYDRLAKYLRPIRKQFPEAVLSVDTFRANIASRVVSEFRIDLVNDISAGSFDGAMFETIAKLNVPYIMMHMSGTPQTMQQNPKYEHITKEISMFFAKRVEQLKLLGVSDIIIDPGFGFGKTLEHNYTLLQQLDYFKILELPLMVGVSRKSMIYKLLETSPQQSLNGTTAVNVLALLGGANILRVHDVKEAVEAIKIVGQYK